MPALFFALYGRLWHNASAARRKPTKPPIFKRRQFRYFYFTFFVRESEFLRTDNMITRAARDITVYAVAMPYAPIRQDSGIYCLDVISYAPAAARTFHAHTYRHMRIGSPSIICRYLSYFNIWLSE